MARQVAEAPPVVSTEGVGRYTIARTWELTPRLIAAFASGVGDPNPFYLDDVREGGLVGHPGMAFTFQWNSRHTPGVEIDPTVARLGVHAWADVRFTRPFRRGDVITSQGRTIAVEQTKPGVLSTQRVTMTDASGAEVAVMDTAGITRGCRTDGPDRRIAEAVALPSLPEDDRGLAWEADIGIAKDAAHVYTECADIWNPIHTERGVALAAGLPDIILHGSATLTIALREVINRAFGGDPRSVRRFAGQFRAMVIPGERIAVRCLRERTSAEGREIFFEVLNQSGAQAIREGLVVAG